MVTGRPVPDCRASRTLGGLAVLLVLSLAPSPAQGQQPAPAGRELGGHRFSLPSLFSPPLLMTYFSFRQGMAMTEVQNETFETGPGSQTLRLGGLVQQLRTGFRVLPWLALLAGAEVQAVAGANAKSLVLQGVSLDGSFALGPLFRLYRNERHGTAVATALRYQQRFGRTILPTRAVALVQSAANTDEVPNGSDVRSTLRQIEKNLWIKRGVRTANLEVSVAQRLHDNVGLVASLQTRIGGIVYDAEGDEGDVESVHARRSLVSPALQVSANTLPWVPLALSLEYRHQRVFDSFEADVANLQRSRHSIGGGLAYAGRPELVLGVFTTYRIGRLAGQLRDSVFAELQIDYVFH